MLPVLLHPFNVKPSWQLLTIKRFIVWHASVKCTQDYFLKKKKETKKKKEKNHSLRGDQFSSVTHSCPTLCYPMNRSKPGFPVHWQVPNPCPLSRWCHPSISSSEVPFSSCPQSFPATRWFQMSQLFRSGGQSIGVSASTSVLPMNTKDWFPLGWTGWISCNPRDSQEYSPASQFKSIKYSALSFLYCPILTSIYDYWKNHSLD